MIAEPDEDEVDSAFAAEEPRVSFYMNWSKYGMTTNGHNWSVSMTSSVKKQFILSLQKCQKWK
jgi:hypothetical protein